MKPYNLMIFSLIMLFISTVYFAGFTGEIRGKHKLCSNIGGVLVKEANAYYCIDKFYYELGYKNEFGFDNIPINFTKLDIMAKPQIP